MTSPLDDLAALLRAAAWAATTGPPELEDTDLGRALRDMSDEQLRSDPETACVVAGLLSVVGLTVEAELLLDRVDAGRDGPQIANVRALIAAAHGNTGRATSIWTSALSGPTSDDTTATDQIRLNLAALAFRDGDPRRAAAWITEVPSGPYTGTGRGTATLGAVAKLTADVWIGADPPDLTQLDDLLEAVRSDDTIQPVTAVEATAQLAATAFEVAVATGAWEQADEYLATIELAAQTLGASLGADDPITLSIRGLCASAEVRHAIDTGAAGRATHALVTLGQVAERAASRFGPADLRVVRLRVEHAVATLQVARSRRTLTDVQQALDRAGLAVELASVACAPSHPLTLEVTGCLHDCRMLAAEVLGLQRYLLPSPRPQVLAAPVSLVVTTLAADEEQIRARLSWPDTGGLVRVRRGAGPPPWPPGHPLPVDLLDSYGHEVTGEWREIDDGFAQETTLPRGEPNVVAFVVDGGWAVAGRPVAALLAPPVDDLSVRRMGDRVIVAWLWPAGVREARVSWTTPERGTAIRTLTLTQYQLDGCTVSVEEGGGRVEVRGLVRGPAGTVLSEPRRVDVEGVAPPRLSYRFERDGRRLLGGRRHILHLTADQDLTEVDITVAMSAGPAVSDDRQSWRTVHLVRDVRLRAGEPFMLRFRIPADAESTSVVRCFVDGPRPLAVDHSPIPKLRAH